MIDTNKRPSKNLLRLTLGALGIVFGDIGTSPLYAMVITTLLAFVAMTNLWKWTLPLALINELYAIY